MKKIKIFSLFAIMLFVFSLVSVIGKADVVYETPVAGAKMTGTGPFTMTSDKCFVSIGVSGVDLTQDNIYFSIKYTSEAKNFCYHINSESDSYCVAYKVKEQKIGSGEVTEYVDNGKYIVVTAKVTSNIKSVLAENGDWDKKLIWLNIK